MSLKVKFLLLVMIINFCSSSSIGKRSAENRAAGQKIFATGGGIVRAGDNVTLSLFVGDTWDSCYWFRYDHAKADGKHDYDYCSFDFDKDTNTTEIHKCDNPELKAMITPLSDDLLSCKILLTNMSSEMEGRWAARLDTDMEMKEIQLIMETDVEKIEVEVDEKEVVAGNNVTVKCKASAGKPDPSLSFMLMNGDESSTDGFTDVRIVDTDDENSVTYQATFIPKISDLGKSLCCKAVQRDLENNTLYENNTVLDKPLNVKFAPQPVEPKGDVIDVEAKTEDDAVFSLVFSSNPEPTSAIWTVTKHDNCEDSKVENTKNSTSRTLQPCKLEISLGQSQSKFKASDLTSVEGNKNLYKVDLQLEKVSEQDYHLNYSATITNSVGEQTYLFRLSESLPSTVAEATTETVQEEGTASTSDAPEDTDTGVNPGVVVLLVIFALMGIISSVVFYKKRQANDIEQTPLTNSR